jgi:hypothetical protein
MPTSSIALLRENGTAPFVNNLINTQPVVWAQGTGAGNSIIYFPNVGTPWAYELRTNFRF